MAPGSNPSPDIYQNFHWYLIIPPLLHQLVPSGSLFRQIWIWLIIPYNKVNLWCVLSCLGWKLFLKRREERFFVWVINNLFNIQLMINNLQLFFKSNLLQLHFSEVYQPLFFPESLNYTHCMWYNSLHAMNWTLKVSVNRQVHVPVVKLNQ